SRRLCGEAPPERSRPLNSPRPRTSALKQSIGASAPSIFPPLALVNVAAQSTMVATDRRGSQMTYPSPEDFERERRRLDAIRPWAQAIAAGIAAMGLLGLVLFAFGKV